jgi:hypothetical protein
MINNKKHDETMKMKLDVSFTFFVFKGNVIILLYKQSIKRPESLFSRFLFFFILRIFKLFNHVHNIYKKNQVIS